MSEEAKLLPCPFCGSENIGSGGDDKIVGSWCVDCQGSGPNQYYGDVEWNTRNLEAAKALLEQHGLVAVPVEPTEAMVDAALALCDDESVPDDQWCQATYKSMIAEAQK